MNRLHLTWFFFVLGAVVVVARLFSIQIFNHSVYLAIAQGQQEFYQELLPRRGEIFTRDGYPLAINRSQFSVYGVPSEILNSLTVAEKIAAILQLDKENISTRFKKSKDPYEPLKSRLSDSEVEALKALNLPGIYFKTSSGRYYPEGDFLSHLLGFVDREGRGRYGLEGRYDKELSGRPGFLSGQKDALGDWTGNGRFEPAYDGDNLTLTIDHLIQYKAEKELEKLNELYKPKEGSILIIEPRTGAIRGMASLPNFDPNNYQQVLDISTFLNPVIHSQFEPGSVAKVLTMASAINDGKITPETTYEDKGSRIIDDYEIKNFDSKAYGRMTMADALEKSLNLGAIFAAETMEKKIYFEYLKKFGLGEKTGIELSGELRGDVSNLNYEIGVNYATAAFGQGISMTPLQLAMAIGAIANDGKLMRPLIFNGSSPEVMRMVVSEKTAKTVKEMMQRALERGYPDAGVQGFNLAAKTGTAQIAEFGGYAEDKWTHSFIGFGPTENPEFLILIRLDQPKGVRYAATSLSGTFKNLAEFLLGFYKIMS